MINPTKNRKGWMKESKRHRTAYIKGKLKSMYKLVNPYPMPSDKEKRRIEEDMQIRESAMSELKDAEEGEVYWNQFYWGAVVYIKKDGIIRKATTQEADAWAKKYEQDEEDRLKDRQTARKALRAKGFTDERINDLLYPDGDGP
jgi:gamma-glutamylcyclotransferase (GGCT)/AIG2-like uncharacterized protein YtfP